jgi:hypothetical protein
MGSTRTLVYLDPAGTPSSRHAAVLAPEAIKLDVFNGDAVLDAYGRYDGVTTVQQQVALAYGVPRGSLAHAPEIGHDFLKLPRVNREGLEQEIQRLAPLATPVNKLIARGQMVIIAVHSEHPKRTESRIIVTYRLAGDKEPRSIFVGGEPSIPEQEAASPAAAYAIYLWVADNGRYTPGDDIEAEPGYFLVHGLTRRQVLGGDYDGVPQLTLRIHLVMNAHGAEACTDGTLLVTTTEAVGETTPPGELNPNYHESVLVIDADKIQPSTTPRVVDLTTDDFVRVRCGELGGPPLLGFPAITHIGLRDAKQLHDGSILLSRGGVFTRMPLEQLRTKTALTSAPVWYLTGAQGEHIGWDIKVDPENPEHVWQLGAAEVTPGTLWQFDLTNPTGANNADRVGIGTNYDPGFWGGSHIDFDADGNLWIPRSGGAAGAPFGTAGTPDIACFTRAQLNTLNDGTPPINLTPDRTITSSALTALNLTREYMWGFAIRDGLMFVCTYDFGSLPRPAARILIFDSAALAGGAHEPISVVSGLPTRAVQLTFAPSV